MSALVVQTGRCQDCEFFNPDLSNAKPEWNQRGECRRHAPVDVDNGADTAEPIWPSTSALGDWCGDFARRSR